MASNAHFCFILLAALGCGLIGGLFFAFSNFVMRALARLPDAQGITAMQSINVTVLNPLFLGIFLGTAIVSALLAGHGLLHLREPGAAWSIAGGLLYLVGNLIVTSACNVPRNNALARLDPAAAGAADAWRAYVRDWNGWNHVRTATRSGGSAVVRGSVVPAGLNATKGLHMAAERARVVRNPEVAHMTDTDRIVKQTLLKAPLERVWRAISDPKRFGTWFGAEFDGDFAPGARLTGRITPTQVDADIAKMQEPYSGTPFEITIERIEPMRLFSLRWHPNAVEPGTDYSKEPTTLVEFELQEVDGGTLLTLTESGYDNIPLERRAAAFESNEQGWEAQMGLIAKYLAQTA